MPLYVAAIAKGCTAASAFNDLGTLLAQRGQMAAAVVHFEIGLFAAIPPREAHRNLCLALEELAARPARQRTRRSGGTVYQVGATPR